MVLRIMKFLLVVIIALLVGKVGYVMAGQEEDAWEKLNKFSIPALKAFLARYPNVQSATDLKLYVSALEEFTAIKAGKKKPTFAISFQALGSEWEKYYKREAEPRIQGYCSQVQGDTIYGGILLFGGPSDGFYCSPIFATKLPHAYFEDEGMIPIVPYGDGSIITFKTNAPKLVWYNGVTFISEGDSILYFGVIDSIGGLVHLQGKGKCILPDGIEMNF